MSSRQAYPLFTLLLQTADTKLSQSKQHQLSDISCTCACSVQPTHMLHHVLCDGREGQLTSPNTADTADSRDGELCKGKGM